MKGLLYTRRVTVQTVSKLVRRGGGAWSDIPPKLNIGRPSVISRQQPPITSNNRTHQ